MIKHILLLFVLSLITYSQAVSQSETTSESPANSILKLNEVFQIFPNKKLGNTIYLNKKKLISREDLTLIDILEAPEGYVYLGQDETENSVLGYTGSQDAKFIGLKGGFYQLSIGKNGKKKIYWTNEKNRIIDLLPRRNTATGLVFNDVDMAVFYHIAKGETIETEEGKERYQYTFNLHSISMQTFEVKHLPLAIKDFSLKLHLEWINGDTIKYTLSNGKVETVTIK
ncbi:MAG: hypothetical protein HQ517_17075 [SAR324 cluster bacterium]|nr:hypothetical protein [SAR324 cluster bacterium]